MREARGTARGTTERGERDGERDDRERRQGRPTGTTERGDRGGRERRPTGTISEDRLSQRMEKVMLLIIEKLIIMQVKWQLQRFIWTWRWSQQTHCKGNPQFNFHKYMMRALEADFKVVGIHMELISISCILFFKLCILASIFLQLVSMEIRGNFLVAERGWMACILLYSICSLHCKKHPDFSSRVIFLFDESLTVLHHRETASACSRYELPSYILTVTKLQLQYKFDSCVMGKCLFIIPRLVIG
ncbi:MLO-like protein 1 [Linum perenne]